MNTVGLELESSKIELVKLRKKQKELTSKLGQRKVVLVFMQSTISKVESRLRELLAIESTISFINLKN